ncbi:hypothetical protein NST99_32550 [Paenibacillus sp. FSL L8-0470]|uniref:hypothetical protein n=1 Tax=unclassified Paenibacillus TaxID=185978 RepID=UPI0030FB700F
MAVKKSEDILNKPEIDDLVRAVEEATRATVMSTTRFIEPAGSTLSRAMSKRNHIVFGRRGSGKTSLLLKAKRDLSLKRTPVAFVDMEQFKSHSYPDVLISVLIATLESFKEWVQEVGLNSTNKISWWKKVFGAQPERSPLNKTKSGQLVINLNQQIENLNTILHSEDEADLSYKWSSGDSVEAENTGELGVELKGIKAGVNSKETRKNDSNIEVTEASRRSKVNYLHRHMLDFRKLFKEISDLAGTDAFLMLDDLYHIRRSDQANVLDYFHRATKGNQVWLKAGTIRHRTDWYLHSDPPKGLKLGDDADEIDLDITLEKFSIARTFLSSVLQEIAEEAGSQNPRIIMAESAMDRLVLASGGVARDFLTIFRRSVEVARERGGGFRGPKIGAEDVNRAAGEHDSSKREELKRDTNDERERLEKLFENVREFCFNTGTNCFLVERDWNQDGAKDIEELVDLRLIHRINPRVTVRDRAGKLYIAYMLDLSQYTGDRKRRGLNMISFWSKDGSDQLRKASLIFAERPVSGK